MRAARANDALGLRTADVLPFGVAQGLNMARTDADRIAMDGRMGERRALYRPGIRSLIFTIAVAASLPGLLAGGLVLVQLWRANQETNQATLLEAARQFSAAIDGEVGNVEQELMVLAGFGPTTAGPFVAMARSVVETFGGEGSWITLSDTSGRELFNTLRPQKDGPAEPDEFGIVQTVIETGRPHISDVFVSRRVPRAVVAIAIPGFSNGQVKYVLQMALPRAFLSRAAAREIVSGLDCCRGG